MKLSPQTAPERRSPGWPLANVGRLVVAAGQAVATALHGGEELLEVHFQGVEDVVGVVLGAEADLTLTGAGLFDDVLGVVLCLLDDFLFGGAVVRRRPP